MINIRPESTADRPILREFNSFNFDESMVNRVETLKDSIGIDYSWVLENEGLVAGSIFMLPATISTVNSNITIMQLALLSIAKHQKIRGFGTQLVKHVLKTYRDYAGMMVIGKPEYYERFGFTNASGFNLVSRWKVTPEHFLIQELKRGSLHQINGVIDYDPVWDISE